MPWMETTKVDQRMRFIIRAQSEEVSMAEACREFDISRPTGYKWLRRYNQQGLDGLEDRSRAPDEIPHKTDEELEQMICSLREQYPKFGPKKLRAWLNRNHPERDWPVCSTIGAILERNDLVEPREPSRKTPPREKPLEEADAPNRIWSADFKGQFELQDGAVCYPLTITDNYSRMLLGCKSLCSTQTAPVRRYFRWAFEQWGVPEAIRTDNGVPFASTAPRGLSRLSAWWLRLGVDHERIDPGEPQQNGRHERMHLTLKQYTARPAAGSSERQQETFDEFRHFYNRLRPHEALDQTVPADYYEPSDRPMPESLPAEDYPGCDFARKVASTGHIKLAGDTLYISNAVIGHRVGVTEIEPDVWVVTYADKDLGYFETGEPTLSPIPNEMKLSRNRP